MKRIALLLASALPLTLGTAATAKDAPATASAVLTPVAAQKWVDVQGFPGVKISVLEGEADKGGHHALHKLPAGFSAPLHTHTADHFVTVVSGNLSLTVDGKETKLPPGSWFAFKGKKAHLTKCEAGADCVLSIDSRDKWDVNVVDKKDAAKDAPKKDAAKK